MQAVMEGSKKCGGGGGTYEEIGNMNITIKTA